MGEHCFGERDKRVIDLEHKNGDGHKDSGRYYNGGNCSRGLTSTQIRKLIETGELYNRIQPMCVKCHRIKTFEEREYKKRMAQDYIAPIPLFECL